MKVRRRKGSVRRERREWEGTDIGLKEEGRSKSKGDMGVTGKGEGGG